MTTRSDCVDLLEKRLKSRFSARQVLLQPLAPQDAFTLLRSLLSLPEGYIFSSLFTTSWGSSISETLNDPRVIEFVLHGLKAGRSAGWLVSWALAGISRLSPATPRLSADLLLWTPIKSSLLSARSDVAAVDLSIVEVLVLTAVVRSKRSITFPSRLDAGSDVNGNGVGASATLKRGREERDTHDGLCFSHAFGDLKTFTTGLNDVLVPPQRPATSALPLKTTQRPASSAFPATKQCDPALFLPQQAAGTQHEAVATLLQLPLAPSNIKKTIRSTAYAVHIPCAPQPSLTAVPAVRPVLFAGATDALVPVRQLAGTRTKPVSKWPVPYPPMLPGSVTNAPVLPHPNSAIFAPLPLPLPSIAQSAFVDEKSLVHFQTRSRVQPTPAKPSKQQPVQTPTHRPAHLTILPPPAALPPQRLSPVLPQAPNRLHRPRWQIEENSALRALETLVDLDLVRFSGAPPSKLQRGSPDASIASAAAGGSSWSGLDAERAREALRWAPLEVDVAASRAALERAVRSGRLPTDIARWVVSSTLPATTFSGAS